MKSKWFGAACLLAGIAGIVAQTGSTGIGAKYGTRDPRTCASRKEPVNGPISAAAATRYFTCDFEKESDAASGQRQLSLVSDVKLTVGKPISYVAAYETYPDLQLSGADIRQPVYPLQGSHKAYICNPLENGNAGHNCTLSDAPKTSGVCYKSESHDWRCLLKSDTQPATREQAAPPK